MNKIFRHVALRGVAATIPKEKENFSFYYDIYGQKSIDKIIKATGINTVRIAPIDRTTSDYCLDAAKNLLSTMEISVDTIDGVIFVSQTPDYIMPVTSALIQNALGISSKSIAFDINYGCSGYVYGLFQASLLIESGYCNRVLVCAGDTLARYVNDKDRSLKMVIGDAGTASIVEKVIEEQISSFDFYTNGAGKQHLIIEAGAGRIPYCKGITDAESVDIDGNTRNKENLYMNGMEIMKFALEEVKKVVENVLKNASWNHSEVENWYFHQANLFIVNYLEKILQIKSNVPIYLDKVGNTSSATIPLTLCGSHGDNFINSEKNVLCGFGVGLSCAATVQTFKNLYCAPIREI